jgi:hypothetical protein
MLSKAGAPDSHSVPLCVLPLMGLQLNFFSLICKHWVKLCFRFYLPLDENSILEVAVHPSYSNFFLETWQKRLIW